MKDLNDDLKNKSHMLLGMISEIQDELQTAFVTEDIVNCYEELGDNEWFVLGHMKCYGIDIPQTIPDRSERLQAEITSGKTIVADKDDDLSDRLDSLLIKKIGILAAILKKEITSGVMKYDSMIVDKSFVEDICLDILYINQKTVELVPEFLSLSKTESEEQSLTIEQVRERIANKLLKRHDGGAMTTESDLNRNLDAERSLLEGK
jgi:NTP pyrophosphatase (non-canonical NTP hydrolase)